MPTRRALAVFALPALLLLALPLGITTVAAQTGDEGVQQVGTLPRFPADSYAALGERIRPASHGGDRATAIGGTLIGIPRVRQLWQVYPTSNSVGDGPTAIAVRDLDTLKIVQTFTIPVALSRAAVGSNAGDWLHAVDGTRRIFLVGFDTTRGSIRTVIEVDLKSFAQRFIDITLPFGVVNSTVPGATRVLQGYLPGGLEYDPYDDALLLLFGGPQIAISPTTFVHRIDLRTSTQKTRQLRACTGELPTLSGTTGKLSGIVTQDHVYFPCHRQGNIGAVVKVKRNELFDSAAPETPTVSGTDPTGPTTVSDEEFVAGPGFLETAFADPGSGRIFLVTLSSEIWAYDIATSSFVGVVAGGVEGQAQVNTGFGLDEFTGRIFLQSERLGLGIAEGRFYPIPQARTFSQYKTASQERVISDSKNERIFVLTGTIQARAAAYKVFDVGPHPVPPLPPDPDRNTTDIEEQPGVTEVRYFASGTGYGVRTLLAKGIAAAPPAPAVGITSPTGGVLADNINSKCGFTDRELTVGRVSRAEYDTGSASAQAVGVDVDERTKLDLVNPSRCDLTARSGSTGFPGIFSTDPAPSTVPVGSRLREIESDDETPKPLAWNRVPADCASSAIDETRVEDKSENEGNSQATVVCPLPGDKLTAHSIGYLTGAVSVGRAETTTEIRRENNKDDNGKTIVSTVVSEAQDIDLAGVIKIGRITSVAESRSNGRPQKDAMSTHTITIQGVRLGDTVICEKVTEVNGTTRPSAQVGNNCSMNDLLRTLNTAANGRAEFRSASGRDDGLLRGSAKGASTAVQKSVARQTSDQALTGDRSNELPALEMTVYNDNPKFGRARQVLQFAGVASAATYNIALNPTGIGFDDIFDGEDEFEDDFEPGGSELDEFLPSVDVLPPSTTASSSYDGGRSGSIIERAVRALARGIRMFFTNPRHMLLLLTAWSLFSLPGVLSRRRRLLVTARSD